ncbi:phosphotransferase [Herpetosiphon geysericola]|uniref:Aminoglycoside phosphotransferase domain-containing protein n=1 Tax=Herpetosiphon geysericola TaxID=70996 RepID=A0A0P6YS55_9CHLR|nr:phosphotransferase [Herpetosiphon geysericola]KPL86110.1 hypothetical protein SE18_14675 [Herpetosiphon geysericola]
MQQLDLLWETGDAAQALQQRFGWDAASANAWVSALLHEHYGLAEIQILRCSISAGNAILWLNNDHDRWIFKISVDQGRHAQIEQSVELQHWLSVQQISVPLIVPSKAGQRTLKINERCVYLQQWLDGTPPDPESSQQLWRIGEATAKLQQCFTSYPAAVDLPQVLFPLDQVCMGLAAWLGDTAGAEPLQHQLNQLAQQGLEHLPRGVCHNDIRAANLLFKADQLQAVLDFEEVGWRCLVLELAWTAVHGLTLYRNWQPATVAQQQAIIAGYQTIRPLYADELAILPSLCRLQSLYLLCSQGSTALDAIERLKELNWD